MRETTLNSEALKLLCDQIGLSKEAVAVVFDHLPSQEEVLAQYELLNKDVKAFFEDNNSRLCRWQRYLALYAAFALLAHDLYVKRGIPETIYQNTMHDIARWEEEHFIRHGEHGLSEVDWLYRHVRLELFALGELQFEPLAAAECELPGALRELPVLNVHIPKGADLAKRADSYRQAMEFWKLDAAVAVCHSWLLGPTLSQWLKPDSRILAFQSEFTIAHLDEECRQAEERIFGLIQDDFTAYPSHTSLQKQAKEALLRGEIIPSAYGYRPMHLKSLTDGFISKAYVR